MKRLSKSLIKILYIALFIYILAACYKGKLPDDLEFMIKKYPELAVMEETFEKRNLDPAKIDIRKDLKSGQFPSFLQWDDRWAYLAYNGSIMAVEGNIPTAMSSIYCHFIKDKPIDPYQMGQFFEKNNWTVTNMGTSWNAIEKGSLYLGLKYKVVTASERDLVNNLNQGKILLASVVGGDFTKDSGLIIIYGLKDGKYLVSDPLSKKNSASLWDHKNLYNQIIHIWAFSRQ
ncbi:MAG: hypothetical protein Q4E50_05120 [Tissierellia bacterium]|nr:hypothetical protein [Tissierellia bacterium]